MVSGADPRYSHPSLRSNLDSYSSSDDKPYSPSRRSARHSSYTTSTSRDYRSAHQPRRSRPQHHDSDNNDDRSSSRTYRQRQQDRPPRREHSTYDKIGKVALAVGLVQIVAGAVQIWMTRKQAEQEEADRRVRRRAFERAKARRRRDEERMERLERLREEDEERLQRLAAERDVPAARRIAFPGSDERDDDDNDDDDAQERECGGERYWRRMGSRSRSRSRPADVT